MQPGHSDSVTTDRLRIPSAYHGHLLFDQVADPDVFFIDTKSIEKEIISKMTKREIDVISLMAKGKSDKDISLALSISGKTVQTYTQKLYKKLAITNRTEAAVKAAKLGLV